VDLIFLGKRNFTKKIEDNFVLLWWVLFLAKSGDFERERSREGGIRGRVRESGVVKALYTSWYHFCALKR
jgi:hypothetical protein